MKIMRVVEKLGYWGKTPNEKMTMIGLGEAYSLWSALEKRYDKLITTKILAAHIKDSDLKIIVKKGIEILQSQIILLENLVKEFYVPMPNRPPEDAIFSVNLNTITDHQIYREIYNGMGDFMFKHISNFQRSHSSYLRETFRKFLTEEMDLYDEFYEYGKLKGYLHEPPSFRN